MTGRQPAYTYSCGNCAASFLENGESWVGHLRECTHRPVCRPVRCLSREAVLEVVARWREYAATLRRYDEAGLKGDRSERARAFGDAANELEDVLNGDS